jgi:hypothetical protein
MLWVTLGGIIILQLCNVCKELIVPYEPRWPRLAGSQHLFMAWKTGEEVTGGGSLFWNWVRQMITVQVRGNTKSDLLQHVLWMTPGSWVNYFKSCVDIQYLVIKKKGKEPEKVNWKEDFKIGDISKENTKCSPVTRRKQTWNTYPYHVRCCSSRFIRKPLTLKQWPSSSSSLSIFLCQS